MRPAPPHATRGAARQKVFIKECALQQTDSVWIAAGCPAAVLAAPGYWGAWTDRVARAFIVAAQRAGADAVEVPCLSAGAVALFAASHGLRTVAHLDTPADPNAIAKAADAGITIFHTDAAHLADASLTEALAGRAHCLVLSGAIPSAECLVRLHDSGLDVVLLFPSADVVTRMQSASRLSPAIAPHVLFGCETTSRQPIPAAVMGVMAAASGAAMIRQHLALARYFGREDASHFLTQRDFRELVHNLRAAERIVGVHTMGQSAASESFGEPAPQGRRAGTRPADDRAAAAAASRGTTALFSRMPGDSVSVTANTVRLSGHGRFFASELVAGVAAVIDLAAAPGTAPDALEMLLKRLKRSGTVDFTTALVLGGEPECIRTLFSQYEIPCTAVRSSWLSAILAAANAVHPTDVLVWLPANNVLADPALIDRMVIQHVKSNSDLTICPDAPRGVAPKLLSAAALQRISTFTAGCADAETVERLLRNRRVFRVQELIVEESLRRPELDLTWHNGTADLFTKIVRSGSESAAELIGLASHLTADSASPGDARTQTLACEPLCSYTTVTHGDDPTASF